MESKDQSIYQLLTNLCEKFADEQNVFSKVSFTKKLRSKAYEQLIFKNHSTKEKDCTITNPFSKIYSWVFTLKNQFNEEDIAERITLCLESLESHQNIDKIILENVLHFLFPLRTYPKNDNTTSVNDIFSLPKHEENSWRTFTNSDFTLKNDTNRYTEFDNNSFKLNNHNDYMLHSKANNNNVKSKNKYQPDNLKSNETPQIDIWEKIYENTENYERNWENIESICTYENPVFLSESKIKYVNLDDFIRDLKYVMVGIPSKIFKFNEDHKFYLAPVSLQGLYFNTLNAISDTFICCGNNYIVLENISSENACSENCQMGVLLKEFCESIRRYLSYYRTAIISISTKYSLNHVSSIAKQLLSHLNILREVCQCCLIEDSSSINLLNYLYKSILTTSNEDISNLLLSIFYPCCQVYFSHFLQPWLFDGALNDPYDEFFLKRVPKYATKHDRWYWTKCYMVNHSMIPDFLLSFENSILLCGKSTQLLKFSLPDSPLYRELSTERPSLMCCLTSQKLLEYKQTAQIYNLKVNNACGSVFSFFDVIHRSSESNDKFLSMVAYKRTVTLKRIELQKLNDIKEKNEEKERKLNLLREQYYSALQEKRTELLQEMAKEIKENETQHQMDLLQKKIIEDESNNLIKYYTTLLEAADNRRKIADVHINRLKHIQLDLHQNTELVSSKIVSPQEESLEIEEIIEDIEVNDTESNSNENISDNADDKEELQINTQIHSLDIINANVETEEDTTRNSNPALDNFAIARQNKAKVMSSEFGLWGQLPEKKKTLIINVDDLTDAQRNKLKVLSTEFHMDYESNKFAGGDVYRGKTCLREKQTLKNKNVITASETETNANNNELNSNQIHTDDENQKEVPNNINDCQKNQENASNLKLDFIHLKTPSIFSQFLKTRNFEFDKISPMSIGSTPMSDLTPISTHNFSLATTANTNFSEDCFNFNVLPNNNNNAAAFEDNMLQNKTFSKKASIEDVKAMPKNRLHFYLEQSILVPLNTQIKLVSNELLKYFVINLNYLKVLNNLRNYYFLMDGEFGRNITNSLFEKLYSVNNPSELLNFCTLQSIVNNSVYNLEESAESLSFKINNVPKRFDLQDPNVLNCLFLTYKITWPLNILLPLDTLEKYNEIFTFLMKLHRISWILKKIFNDLKMFTKQLGRKAILLTLSPHYQAIHRFRHLMTQFIQAFQNYINGDVLQTSWELFKKSLLSANSLDNIYDLHTVYIKNILFMCLLNQRSAPIKEVFHKVFIVMFKFYDYLRSRAWVFEDGVYLHPNFTRLEDIYHNFEEMALYLFKIIKKAAMSGYQKHLNQLLTTWDVNNYYTNKLNSNSST